MATWSRSRLVVTSDVRGVLMAGVAPTITLRTNTDTGKLRLGLWVTTIRLAGWVIPFLPANIPFTIRNGRASAFYDGTTHDLPRQLVDWDGVRWPSRDSVLPHGTFVVTLDQEPDKAVPVLVDVSVESVEGVA